MSRKEHARHLASFPDIVDSQPGNQGSPMRSFAPLYEGHRPALLRYLEVLMRSREDAKEIYHDACAKLIAIKALERVSLPERYLWRTAQNLARDRKRERAVHRRLDPIALFDVANHSPSMDSWLETRQRLALVERAVAELTPKRRMAFLLRVVDQLSFEEIAQEMHISTRMAKYHVFHALQHCQEVIRLEEAPRTHRQEDARDSDDPGEPSGTRTQTVAPSTPSAPQESRRPRGTSRKSGRPEATGCGAPLSRG